MENKAGESTLSEIVSLYIVFSHLRHCDSILLYKGPRLRACLIINPSVEGPLRPGDGQRAPRDILYRVPAPAWRHLSIFRGSKPGTGAPGERESAARGCDLSEPNPAVTQPRAHFLVHLDR